MLLKFFLSKPLIFYVIGFSIIRILKNISNINIAKVSNNIKIIKKYIN